MPSSSGWSRYSREVFRGDFMSDVALEMDHVYKKFKRGELYDSLRD
jgi:hypothetical protein